MAVTVLHGDSRELLKIMPDASVDACVCDPPYALVSIVKRFGKPGSAEAKDGATGAYKRASAGFMGKQWDTGETAFDPAFWGEVLRVLKPGARVVAFSGTRTYHRLACAVEDAGFEIWDMIAWLYGSGFPKSHDVSKGIDRMNGDARPVISRERLSNDIRGGALLDIAHGELRAAFERDITSAASAAWEGWGTALKPALEPVCFARKPLDGTVAANVLRHGTGALNIDACRVGSEGGYAFAGLRPGADRSPVSAYGDGLNGKFKEAVKGMGRWPANVVHDGSDEVLDAFPRFDDGSAARFFYSAKADAEDRLGSKHPTVKPVDLMAWLCRLVTPPGGVVLDPFAGTGTTGLAAMRGGFSSILMEREAEYIADIERRLAWARGEGRLTAQESGRLDATKAAGADLPLFSGDAA